MENRNSKKHRGKNKGRIMPTGIYKRTKIMRKNMSKAAIGKKFSKKHRRNLSKALIGKKETEKHRNNIKKSIKKAWKEGKYNNIDKRFLQTKKWRKNHGLKVKQAWEKGCYIKRLKNMKKLMKKLAKSNKGKKRTQVAKEKMSKKHMGKHTSPTTEFKKGHKNSKKQLKQAKKIMNGLWQNPIFRNKMIGENSPCWKGGISKFPYPFAFNEQLKKQTRKRDGYTCQFPGCNKRQDGRLHDVHHIDYDKNNLDPMNLITLCRKHNAKVNFNRKYWKGYFEKWQ